VVGVVALPELSEAYPTADGGAASATTSPHWLNVMSTLLVTLPTLPFSVYSTGRWGADEVTYRLAVPFVGWV
jgi:hypothetical protein